MTLKRALDQKDQAIRYRDRIIGLLGVLLALQVYAYTQLPEIWKVYIPPDLSRPNIVSPDEIPPAYVYAFAKLILERLNYCPKDCDSDYPSNLEHLRHYVTPACFEDLRLHHQRHRSLYRHRVRKLLPLGEEVFDTDTVQRLDRSVYAVEVDYAVEEFVAGVNTRASRTRYPMRIVHTPMPVTLNEYQLSFDCYTGTGPQPLEAT